MNPLVRPVISAVAMIGFFLPFFLFTSRKGQTAVQKANAARWGIALQAVGFFLLYTHSPQFWQSTIEPWQVAASLVFAVLCWLLAWTGPRHLGKQWRMNAALNADHELVQTGPYRIVRHPIYASMLFLIISGCFACGEWPMWPIALVLFLIGMEIRVRVEDKLLERRFGARFEEWRHKTPAYLPFIR
jgi:protein-S-isoprenylcysteine O-methyltransferase Ste14